MAARWMATNLEKMAPAMENRQNMESEETAKMVVNFSKGWKSSKGKPRIGKRMTLKPSTHQKNQNLPEGGLTNTAP
jgi:hypothetical protein